MLQTLWYGLCWGFRLPIQSDPFVLSKGLLKPCHEVCCVVGDACAHLPATRIVVGDSPFRGTAYHRIAAAVTALEHPFGAVTTRPQAAGYGRFGVVVSRQGESDVRECEAVGGGQDDGLMIYEPERAEWEWLVAHWNLHLGNLVALLMVVWEKARMNAVLSLC